jgi:hypothetical protein
MIENDVNQARKQMNISRLEDYTTEQKVEILSRLGAEVRNHQMPIQRYLSLHPEARVSESDIHQLYEWSRSERHRLRSVDTPSRGSRQISVPLELLVGSGQTRLALVRPFYVRKAVQQFNSVCPAPNTSNVGDSLNSAGYELKSPPTTI